MQPLPACLRTITTFVPDLLNTSTMHTARALRSVGNGTSNSLHESSGSNALLQRSLIIDAALFQLVLFLRMLYICEEAPHSHEAQRLLLCTVAACVPDGQPVFPGPGVHLWRSRVDAPGAPAHPQRGHVLHQAGTKEGAVHHLLPQLRGGAGERGSVVCARTSMARITPSFTPVLCDTDRSIEKEPSTTCCPHGNPLLRHCRCNFQCSTAELALSQASPASWIRTTCRRTCCIARSSAYPTISFTYNEPTSFTNMCMMWQCGPRKRGSTYSGTQRAMNLNLLRPCSSTRTQSP